MFFQILLVDNPSRNICRPMRRIHISMRTRKMWFPDLPGERKQTQESPHWTVKGKGRGCVIERFGGRCYKC